MVPAGVCVCVCVCVCDYNGRDVYFKITFLRQISFSMDYMWSQESRMDAVTRKSTYLQHIQSTTHL